MTGLLVVALLFLVLANGFFVAAEFALVRARRSRMEQLAEEKQRGARLSLHQMDHISEYLAACQLGITMASIGIGFLGEPALAKLLEGPLGEVAGHGVAVALAIVIAYMISTALHITAGEQVPKIFSIVHAEGVARRSARPLELFTKVLRPAVRLLNAASNGMLRAVGVNSGAEFEEASSADDLKLLIARSAHGGVLDPGEAVMLSGVFHLHEQEARQVMTPLPAVVTVDASDTVETALRRCTDSGHTRLVVTEEGNTDRVKGTVHNNSLVRRLMNDGPEATIGDLVKDAVIVPETKALDDLLADLQRERLPMAIVIDEYGRTAGIVTIEDIVEEVVGEIADETDPARGAVRQLANGDWYVRGHAPITDLVDYGIDLPSDTDAYNSVGGFVFSELGRLPKRGDMVRENGYSVRVESVRENRVEAVRIRDHEPGRREPQGGREAIVKNGDDGSSVRDED
ncbi:MAG TPA: hemolysin family protein [Thermoleophilaceae bacterium]|nr:hemolysin family protein [Thermoleophilaceae bacterium]